MPRLSGFDAGALNRLLAAQRGIVTRDQAVACRMSQAAIRHRIRPDGPWRVVLPGVYQSGQGATTGKQRAVAAYLYPGNAIAITGTAALAWYSISALPVDVIDVLVPLESYRCDTRFVRLHRTRVVPDVGREGIVRYASPARATADAARQLDSLTDVRAVVAAGVQRRKVSIADLGVELRLGPVRGSATLRAVLAEVADGVRSVAEGDLRTLIKRSSLPEPLYNPRLYVGSEFLAEADAWWKDYGVAAEVDSRQWHLSPADWEATLARHARMTAHGILVLHFPPGRIRSEGPRVIAEIAAALASSAGRKLPRIVTVPTITLPAVTGSAITGRAVTVAAACRPVPGQPVPGQSAPGWSAAR
jgi:hypothetical protein